MVTLNRYSVTKDVSIAFANWFEERIDKYGATLDQRVNQVLAVRRRRRRRRRSRDAAHGQAYAPWAAVAPPYGPHVRADAASFGPTHKTTYSV